MSPWILLVCLAVNVARAEINQYGEYIPLAGSTLKSLFVLAVHGTRTPLYGPFKGDLGATQFPIGQKDLTSAGKTMMEHVGKTLKRRYAWYLNSWIEPKSWLVTAYNSALTTNSAEILAAAMFGGTNVPEVKTTFSDYFDKTHLVYDTVEVTQCPRYVCLRNRVRASTSPSRNELEFYDSLYQYLGKWMNTAEDFYKIYDRIQMEKLNGVRLNSWAANIDPIRSSICKRRYKKVQAGYDKTSFKFMTDPLMKWITSIFRLDPTTYSFDEVVTVKSVGFKDIHVHVTEDILPNILGWEMFSISYRKKFDRPFVAEVGDVVLFEIHKTTNVFGQNIEFLKIFYYSPSADSPFRRFEEMDLDQYLTVYDIGSGDYFHSGFLRYLMFPNSFTDQCRLATPWYNNFRLRSYFDTCNPA